MRVRDVHPTSSSPDRTAARGRASLLLVLRVRRGGAPKLSAAEVACLIVLPATMRAQWGSLGGCPLLVRHPLRRLAVVAEGARPPAAVDAWAVQLLLGSIGHHLEGSHGHTTSRTALITPSTVARSRRQLPTLARADGQSRRIELKRASATTKRLSCEANAVASIRGCATRDFHFEPRMNIRAVPALHALDWAKNQKHIQAKRPEQDRETTRDRQEIPFAKAKSFTCTANHPLLYESRSAGAAAFSGHAIARPSRLSH